MLIIDDIAANLDAMKTILRCDDMQVVTACSAREAMDVLLERPVSVALIDVQMPEMDGIELAELMRGVERTRHIPIIFVTAGTRESARVFKGYEAGAVDFLFKPIDEYVVRSKVEVLVSLDRRRRRLAIALEEAQIARRETEFLFRLAELTSSCTKPEEVFEPALGAARTLLAADRASIVLVDETDVMRVPDSAIWISDATRDDIPEREAIDGEGSAALAVIPLVYQQQVLGKLVLRWNRPRDFTRHEEDLGLTIASHVAHALERARIQDAERRARDRLASLQQITAALNQVSSREQIGDVCLPAICEVVGATVGALHVVDEGGGVLEAVRVLGMSPGETEHVRRVSLARAPSQPVFIDSVAEVRPDEPFAGVLQAGAIVPLVIEARVIGLLGVGFPGRRRMTEDERAFFLAIADQCAQALERSRLLEVERRSRRAAEHAERRRAALQSISDAALAHLGLVALLGEMLARVCRIFSADTATLFLLEGDHLRLKAVSGLDMAATEKPAFPISRGVMGQAIREKRAIAVEDVASAEVVWLGDKLRCLAVVPLVRGDEIIGVLHMGRGDARPFEDDELDLFEHVGARFATAVDRTVAYERVRRMEEHLRIALASGQMGVWEWVPATERMTWSSKIEEIYGFAPGTFPGTIEAYECALHADDREQVVAQIKASIEEKRDLALQYRIVRRDGQIRWVSWRGKLFTDDLGNIESLTGTCADVTERVELERLREQTMEALERDMQLNELFVATLTHDLRVPLASMAMGLSVLGVMGELGDAQRQLVRRMTAASQRMARMISQLLDLTRSRLGGGIPVSRTACDLVAIVRAGVAELELVHPSAVFTIDADPSVEGQWDGDRIAQIVSNLVGNAAVYGSDAGPIRIGVRADRETARLTVHNAGTPIPSDVLPTLFEPFAPRRQPSESGGLGLGLYITSQIVAAHGGTIEVTSTARDGTELVVTLPR